MQLSRRLADLRCQGRGTNQRFNIPKDQKFMINGKETDAFGLKKGMNVTAQKVVEEPEVVVTQR